MILNQTIPQKILRLLRQETDGLGEDATFAQALDLLTEKGYRWGLSVGKDGEDSTYTFATPTSNPYKFRRNTSKDPGRCLCTGITRLLTYSHQ